MLSDPTPCTSTLHIAKVFSTCSTMSRIISSHYSPCRFKTALEKIKPRKGCQPVQRGQRVPRGAGVGAVGSCGCWLQTSVGRSVCFPVSVCLDVCLSVPVSVRSICSQPRSIALAFPGVLTATWFSKNTDLCKFLNRLFKSFLNRLFSSFYVDV